MHNHEVFNSNHSIFQFSGRELALLIYLAQRFAMERSISITTSEIGSIFNISPQSASRDLQKLSSDGYIEWLPSPKGSTVKITQKGIAILHSLHFELERAMHPDRSSLVFSGAVFTGLGEGKYYVSKSNYLNSFKNKLGFEPFPGTLNLRLSPSDVAILDLIRGSFPKIVEGFKEEDRTFGDVLCYPVKIFDSEVNAAIIIPSRTHYSRNTVEIISDINLREKFNLEDGTIVSVRYMLDKVD